MGTLLALIRLLVADRHRLMMENLALRHQLGVLKRTVKRPRIEDSDRMLWILHYKYFRLRGRATLEKRMHRNLMLASRKCFYSDPD